MLLSRQLYAELKAQYPSVKDAIIQPVDVITDSSYVSTFYISLSIPKISQSEKIKIHNWLKARLRTENISLNIKN